MRKRRMETALTILLPISERKIIENVAEESNRSLADVTRELLEAGMSIKGLVA
jgi:hypothetical protein